MKKNRFNFSKHIGSIITILVGVVCGLLFSFYNQSVPKESIWEKLFWPFGLLIILYISMLVHMFIHEAGHLICGLISGYEFSSFRIMSFMLIKQDGKFSLKRLSIAGTGGQCLMSPPDMKDGKLPTLLYNLGGPIANLIVGILFLILFIILSSYPFIASAFFVFSLVGIIFACLNGIPMSMGTVNNDGFNACSMRNNPEALKAFWLQMKINEYISYGKRLKDMPDEWFYMPDSQSMDNSMTAVMGVFYCNRLMDQHRFEEAKQTMDQLLNTASGMVDLHRNLLQCDRLYLELIEDNNSANIQNLFSKKLKKFMKTMDTFPSVIRVEYAYAQLVENNKTKAQEIYKKFKKIAAKYPYPQEVAAEYEYIALVDKLI